MIVIHKPGIKNGYFHRILEKAVKKSSVNYIYSVATFENWDEQSCNYIDSEVSSENSDDEPCNSIDVE